MLLWLRVCMLFHRQSPVTVQDDNLSYPDTGRIQGPLHNFCTNYGTIQPYARHTTCVATVQDCDTSTLSLRTCCGRMHGDRTRTRKKNTERRNVSIACDTMLLEPKTQVTSKKNCFWQSQGAPSTHSRKTKPQDYGRGCNFPSIISMTPSFEVTGLRFSNMRVSPER